MPNYKGLLQEQNLQQKKLLEEIRAIDARVDKALLSKMVNYVCLPTPQQADVICKTLNCTISELYKPNELIVIPKSSNAKKPYTPTGMTNIHVQVEMQLVQRVFSKESMAKLGITSKSDCIRDYLKELAKRLDRIEIKESKQNEHSKND